MTFTLFLVYYKDKLRDNKNQEEIKMRYEVNFSCGHTETVFLYGKRQERERKIKYYEGHHVCSKCYRQSKEKEAAKRCDEVEMHYREYKEKYEYCQTKSDSYNTETKTIIVYVPRVKSNKEVIQ